MDSKDVIRLLEKLKEKTKTGKIVWKEGDYQQDFFETKFENGLIVIHREREEVDFEPEEYEDILGYDIKILNDENRVVLKKDYIVEKDDYSQDDQTIKSNLIDLYESIHKKYYNTEETIAGILNELDNI